MLCPWGANKERWLARPGGNCKEGVEDKVCIPSLGTSVATVRTPNWSGPTGFYLSWRCYHTPNDAFPWGAGHGTLWWTRASEQAGKALRSQQHQCAHVM